METERRREEEKNGDREKRRLKGKREAPTKFPLKATHGQRGGKRKKKRWISVM